MTLLVAAALAVPIGSAQATVPSSISSAIDNGASQSVAGLLPTSEAYQRAMQVVEGLKAGIPSPAPVATAAQLDDITAFTRGAVAGAMADPTVITTSEERARMRDFAKGYLSGALTQLASAPTAGRAAADEAVAKGVFAGVTAAVLGPEPIVSGSDIEAYGRTIAAETFDEMDKNGALLAGLAGSPALSDITLFATDVARAQLGSAPTGIARAQLDAIANFGAGTLDGMVVGVVTGFPQGVPAPAEADLRRWFQTVSEGHSGTAPWTAPASLPLLLAWADASAAAAVTAVDAARESVAGTTPPSTLDEIGAWAVGVAHGAYERLDSITATPANVERDVRAYAEGVTTPGIEYLLTRQHPSLDDAAVTAYAEGLTGGVDDMRGASVDALGLTRTFLEDLASALTSLPPVTTPTQSATLEAFLTGVTDRLTVRMDGIAGLIAEDDPALLAAMAEGLATGAVGLAGGPGMTRPELAQALGNGLATGFLETRNPRVLAEDVFGLTQTAKTWLGATPPASLSTINDLAQSAARDPYAAIQQYGATMGKAPVSWSENKSVAAADQGWGGADDILWLGAFTNASAPIILEEIKEGLGSPSPQPTLDAMNLYVANVTGSLGDPDLARAIDNLTSQEYRTHARRFAQFVLTPTDWVASKDERAAAREVLSATLDNATAIQRFRDAEYAAAAIAFVKATGDGIKEGRPDARQIVKEAKGESFLPAWVDGVVEAIQEVPTAEVRGDISSRVEWIKTATQVVRPIAKEAVGAQVTATKQFAKDSAAWAISTPERLPEAGQPELPLLAFLNASINATLTSLPTVMTDEEHAAVVAYADGIQRAVWAIPSPPSPLDWGVPDQLAMDAYVAGIASGVGQVQDDTRLYLCSWGVNISECPRDEEACDGECPPPPPPPEPECEFDCEFFLYLDNLGAWSENLTAGGVLQMEHPNATPTRTGIAFVARWSAEVLAGHGMCPDFESATFECDGPRGPVAEFAQARNESVAAWAEAVSQGYNNYIDLSDPPNGLVRPLADPILAWAAGVQNAVGVGLIQPARFLPPEGGGPSTPGGPVGAPPQDPSDPAFREELRVWTESVLRAPGKVYDTLWVPFPDMSGFNATVMDLDHLWAHVIWEGGYDALNQSETNLSRMVINATPDAALDAFAEGLANATRDIMIEPAAHDLQLLLGWYQGLAEGGVEAILEGAATIRDEQVPGIAAYAQYVAGTYGPPSPPTGAAIEFLFPPDGEDEEEDSEEEEPAAEEPPEPPSPEEVYLTNLQAHAQGLAEAVLNAPVKPFATNATAYGDLYLAYVHAIANASQALPPVSPDAGFPARLSAWTQAQATAATSAPPTSPERLGPNPNTAMALSFVESFAGTSPWNLPPDAQQKLSWAQAAVEAGVRATCPSTDSTQCALIGEIVGEAFGIALPPELPASPIPLPQEIALLQGIADGAAQGLRGATGGAGDTALVTGLIEGLVPEGANDADAGKIAAAVATALGPHVAQLPASWTHAAASELSTTLLSADPARYQSLASGAAALLVAMAQSGETDPAVAEAKLRAFLAPGSSTSEPSVSASDGLRTATSAQLASAPVLDGLREIRINVSSPAASPIQATWQLAWSTGDPRASSATRIPLAGNDGAYTAAFAPATLAGLPRGATVRFVVIETSPTGARTYPAQGEYAFKPDRDAPTANLTLPASASGASFLVSWTGQDGDSSVASYRIESREGQGEWREWIRATSDPRASFTGAAGRTYSFRATATDVVGHTSTPSAAATITVPNGVAGNAAPTLSFVAPAADAVFGRAIQAAVSASDADGTEPTIRMCIRKADATVDITCPYEGAQTTMELDASKLVDGRYRLHASATDGTLTAEALSPIFTIDRSPPTFRGAIAEADPSRVLLSASLDDASAVTVHIGSDAVPLTQTAPGVWSGQTTLTPGAHTLRFRATDPNGNDATIERSIVVPAAAPPPATPRDNGAPTTPTAPTTPPDDDARTKGTPGAALGLVLAALGAAALAMRRRQ